MKYLFISSEDSLEFNPTNSTYDFTITLPQTLRGDWEIALRRHVHMYHILRIFMYFVIYANTAM